MIHVYVTRSSGGKIQGFSMDGHANFSERGQDIVCAGASAVSFGAINAMEKLTGVEPVVIQSSDGGFLSCEVPENLSPENEQTMQTLLEGMIVSLQTIELDYGHYIKITFKK
ncbi:hypothetical protein Q75_10760 [Bacillus coahuilensis p1.1.43]|uniref:Ribosomal processing cysteine protease Prp n=1 Tax=Bacillus coahuilensis p1.1.43 TaxID=1150625 RepID=A0A147K729_9BACI|nr:ribosomal-processing cysteine protease Prp [Bacillus coahuilensis]KUP05860.1 hypothetical protein Q75_10760 [Bacillus coahuilensis p1.1.43]